MVRGTVAVCGKDVVVTCGRDRFSHIRYHLQEPLRVCAMMKRRGFMSMTIFGNQWNWSERPEGMREQYEAELAQYVATLPDMMTARSRLPDNNFFRKYIPDEEDELTVAWAKPADCEHSFVDSNNDGKDVCRICGEVPA